MHAATGIYNGNCEAISRMDFFETSARLSCGYQRRCATSSTASCNTTMVNTVSPAISKTSHPFQTGSSTGGCADGKAGGRLASGGVSTLTRGCGSNCELPDDD